MIEGSARLMKDGKYPLKDIAEEEGIQTYNSFFKPFKKYRGGTPAEYKRRCAKKSLPALRSRPAGWVPELRLG
jgi:YesN/AraC family two-component response regulator